VRAYEIFNEVGLSTATFADDAGRLDNFKNRLARKDGQNGIVELTPKGKQKFGSDTVQLAKDYDGDLNKFPPQWPTLPGKTNIAFPIQSANNEDEVNYVLLSDIQKTNDFGSTGSKEDNSERQEHGMIKIINDNAPVKIKMGNKLMAVKGAYSFEGMNSLGKEQYIDIMITDTNGKDYGVSMKATASMTVGGGGTAGINSMKPLLVKSIYRHLEDWIESPKPIKGTDEVADAWEDGDHIPHKFVPEMYFVVPENDVKDLITGNKEMGGPIDYMYTGPADVTGKIENGILNIDSGNFQTVDEYIMKDGEPQEMYLRLRRRDVDKNSYTEIDLYTKGKTGFPLLFKNASNDKKNWRLLMTNKFSGPNPPYDWNGKNWIQR
jgi:hypothetical protein